MPYNTLDSLKAYLAISGGAEDALLTDCLTRADAACDALCGRSFAASADQTRRFDLASASDDRRTLYLSDDLCQIASITNGDGSSVALDDVVLLPIGRLPLYGLTLRQRSGQRWNAGDGDGQIVIVGRWAYSLTPPPDVQGAALRLAAYFYHQKDNGGAALVRPLASADGVLQAAAALPADVLALLAPYRRVQP